jgi:Ca-activated chloride channel homolog
VKKQTLAQSAQERHLWGLFITPCVLRKASDQRVVFGPGSLPCKDLAHFGASETDEWANQRIAPMPLSQEQPAFEEPLMRSRLTKAAYGANAQANLPPNAIRSILFRRRCRSGLPPLFLLLVLFVCNGAVRAYSSGLEPLIEDEQFPKSRTDIRVDSTLVQVPVCVTDRHGAIIQGLERGNFRVFEDGVEEKVTSFSRGDVPASIGFILDTSGSMQFRLPMGRSAVARFLKTANSEDEFFLLCFDSRPRLVVPFSNSDERILNAARQVQASGSTALLDAVYAGLREMKNAHNPRRAIVIISDGEDNHSRHTEKAIRTAVREADVQIFAVALREIVYSRRKQIEINGPELLRRLCLDTGGRSFEVDDERDLPSMAARIGIELRSEYVLGYTPTNQNWDGKYRHITLKLIQPPERPHFTARWRRGYYARNQTGQ